MAAPDGGSGGGYWAEVVWGGSGAVVEMARRDRGGEVEQRDNGRAAALFVYLRFVFELSLFLFFVFLFSFYRIDHCIVIVKLWQAVNHQRVGNMTQQGWKLD